MCSVALCCNQALWADIELCTVANIGFKLKFSEGDGAVTPTHPGRRQCRNPYPVLRARPLGRDRVRCAETPTHCLLWNIEDRAVLFLQILIVTEIKISGTGRNHVSRALLTWQNAMEIEGNFF